MSVTKPSATFKIYLEIPYEERDMAKANNCRWCPDAKKWYCVNNTNPLVSKYLKSYFDVPFDLKDDAKKCGARWDGSAWYSYQGNAALISLLENNTTAVKEDRRLFIPI